MKRSGKQNRKALSFFLFSIPYFLISLFSSPFLSRAQDTNFVRKVVCDLSAPDMYGRGYSHNGDSIAAEYIRNCFIDLRVEPLSHGYFQSYSFRAFSMEGNVSFTINKKRLSPFNDYRVAPFSKSIDQEVQIIPADPLILLSRDKIAKFCEKHKKVLSNSFIYLDISQFTDKSENYSALIQKVRELNYNNPFNSLGLLIGRKELPVWFLSNTDYARNYALINIIHTKIDKYAASATIRFSNELKLHKTQNVCAMIEGTVHRDSFVVFTAHYEHLGTMGDSVIFYGANDNASGTAMILDFARHYQENPPACSMLFLAFSGEETGLRGSSHFVDNPLVPLENIKFLINLDMLCGGQDGIMVVNAQENKTKKYYEKMVKVNEKKRYLPAVKNRPNAANSDHYPFTKHIPAVFIFAMGKTAGAYHHFSDTCKNCTFEKYNNIFRLIRDFVDEEL